MLVFLNNAKLHQFILPPASVRVPVPKAGYHNLIFPDFFLLYRRFLMESTFNPT